MSKIKLVPCPKIKKRDLMKALMDGRIFIAQKDSDPLKTHTYKIHWDSNHGYEPVREGLHNWNWRGFKYLHEIVEQQWYEDIPEEGVLCWVDDEEEDAKDHAVLIFSIDGGYKEKSNCTWNYAEPVTAADLYKEQV